MILENTKGHSLEGVISKALADESRKFGYVRASRNSSGTWIPDQGGGLVVLIEDAGIKKPPVDRRVCGCGKPKGVQSFRCRACALDKAKAWMNLSVKSNMYHKGVRDGVR